MYNPLDLITYWDLFTLFLGVLLRFLLVVNYKEKEFNSDFSIVKYFDFKHLIRWSIHILTALTGLLVLPQLFVTYIMPKYLPDLEVWTFLGSTIIGFLGYDLIKIVEKITFKIVKSEKFK